jgi:hypothetical protein
MCLVIYNPLFRVLIFHGLLRFATSIDKVFKYLKQLEEFFFLSITYLSDEHVDLEWQGTAIFKNLL